ncbi:MAG: iron-containing alcohol dehydrogenase [Sulfolobales archaeon]
MVTEITSYGSLKKIFGKGVLRSLGEILRDIFSIQRDTLFMIISSPSSHRVASSPVVESLSAVGFKTREYIVRGGCTQDNIEKAVNICLEQGPRLVIGLGGGSIADLTKIVANRCSIGSIVIPTILSTNAIASPFSVVWKDNISEAIKTGQPTMVIGDLEVLALQEKRYIASGLGDLLAKLISLNDWRLSHIYAGDYYEPMLENLARDLLNRTCQYLDLMSMPNERGIKKLFDLLVMDGLLMELANTTRIVAGCEHLIAFGVEATSGKGMHGEQVSLGILVCSYIQGKDLEEIIRILKKAGLPTKPEELGISQEEMIYALIKAPTTRNWYTSLGKELNRDIAKRLLEKIFIY